MIARQNYLSHSKHKFLHLVAMAQKYYETNSGQASHEHPPATAQVKNTRQDELKTSILNKANQQLEEKKKKHNHD